jgi:hypothetical protein
MCFPLLRPLGAVFLCAWVGSAWPQEPAASPASAAEAPLAPAKPSTWERVGTAVDEFTTTVGDAEAWKERGHWRIAVSPYAPHFRPSEEHQPVWAIGLERQRADDWLAGASFFSNSFGQPSAYVYLGRRYPGLFDVEPLFFQWSAGLMYGYVGQYKSKVPMNVEGFSPGALITLGWQFNPQLSFAVHALGDAGVMFQFGFDLR